MKIFKLFQVKRKSKHTEIVAPTNEEINQMYVDRYEGFNPAVNVIRTKTDFFNDTTVKPSAQITQNLSDHISDINSSTDVKSTARKQNQAMQEFGLNYQELHDLTNLYFKK